MPQNRFHFFLIQKSVIVYNLIKSLLLMKLGPLPSLHLLLLSLAIVVAITISSPSTAMATLGGVRDSGSANSAEVEDLGRFAVQEHNKKQNALLEFVRVVKAKEQVVAGTMHYLTVEVTDAGKKKLYEAKVWVKPWLNFKELQDFTPAGDGPSITPADLGANKDVHGSEWRSVPAHDPVVQDAANHAVKTIQQRSNSLAPYELLEILLAKAQVIEDAAKLDLLLKLKRGSKEEKYKVEVHKTLEGTYKLSQMELQEHSDS